MSATSVEQICDQSLVRAYVINVISRALPEPILAEDATDARSLAPIDMREDVDCMEHCPLKESFADLQPLDWSEGQAVVAALAASRAEYFARYCFLDSSTTDELLEDDDSSADELLKSSTETNILGRTARVVNSGVAYVEESLTVLGDKWDEKWQSVDNAAEMYTSKLEGIVKDKAVALSSKSRSAYLAMDAAVGKYSQHIGELVSDSSYRRNCISAQAQAAHTSAAAFKSKAIAVTQVAASLREKSGSAHTQIVQDGLQAARRKVVTALGSKSGVARCSGSRGGA